MYPHAQVWLAGHSLGGALAAMLSRTYGVPSVSFESPGDLLPARRLHLPLPPVNNPNSSHPPPPAPSSGSGGFTSPPRRSLDDELTTHVLHTADPIPLGQCTGTISTCGIAGFALESRCHTGKVIRYDTVGRLGWSVDIRTHPIHVVVEQLLREDWGVKQPEVKTGTGTRTGKGGWFGWWPGRGKKDGDEGDDEEGGGQDDEEDPDDGQNGGRGVPQAFFEDDDCSDCRRWAYV